MIADQACDDVLRRGQIVHLAMFPPADPPAEQYPYVVPLLYGYDCAGDTPVLYMHTGNHPQSTKLRAIRGNPRVGFAVETDVQIVPSAPNTCMLSTVRYFSVLGAGKIEVLDGSDIDWAKIDWAAPPPPIYGLNVIMRQQTGKMAGSRFLEKWDYDPRLFARLVILKLTVTAYTAKDHAYDFKPQPYP